jgi:hypothetical protein
MSMRSAITAAAVLAILGAVGSPRVWAQADTAAKVTAAKTAADHEALAAQYEKQAAAAKAEAAVHRRMGEAYKGSATATGKTSGVSSMPQHCESIAKSFDEQAKMYDAMAATERELAKAGK